ncbi:MAG TPA: 4Fe-4S binding protein [Prolixibacteraceae bacterium]|nr:4Fe-4S binding protein [Prolixibacteraceae bacterium]
MKTFNNSRWIVAGSVFLFVAFVLSMIQWKTDLPMLLFERFARGAGWIEVGMVSVFGAFIAYKMHDRKESARWRKISWTVFSVWFFLQLFLGILVDMRFLLTGELHLPVPAMMISGPLYRGEKSVMTLLFLSTLVLTGPAWCSQLCYFGAIDNLAAKGKTARKPIRGKFVYKHSLLILLISATLLLRLLGASALLATLAGALFGLGGLLVILLVSRKQRRMVHCTVYCPIGTLVSYLRYISPFRMVIESSCDVCMACSSHCKYDALRLEDIRKKRPGITCTYCGDCLASCKSRSIRYKFLGLTSEQARNLWLFLTLSVYSIFLAMGRI